MPPHHLSLHLSATQCVFQQVDAGPPFERRHPSQCAHMPAASIKRYTQFAQPSDHEDMLSSDGGATCIHTLLLYPIHHLSCQTLFSSALVHIALFTHRRAAIVCSCIVSRLCLHTLLIRRLHVSFLRRLQFSRSELPWISIVSHLHFFSCTLIFSLVSACG